MIKEYTGKFKAEKFDGSLAMIQKYNLDYEYDSDGCCVFYDGIYLTDLVVGEWIVQTIDGYHKWNISPNVFSETFKEVK
ncbi:hypothetical protein [Companilactobacillus nantensis]|uniref:Uncharacterized protein n=1 Tax=Companilactobacillus nantensis DSM 16982 TaxID=1423774 RepID=A0A0R1WJI5_9LACO|nr:hypothetical protein [Companilactobacillus nantensis]KRM15929.1 hypothetical protein FD31_GL000827 [Companilactobacillus nantensis DSM 16982]GEO64796.1 hypothetical protein LNA01_19790 [Companilactobacillus nantensis]